MPVATKAPEGVCQKCDDERDLEAVIKAAQSINRLEEVGYRPAEMDALELKLREAVRSLKGAI